MKLLAQFEVRRSVRSECLLGVSESAKENCLIPISHSTSRLPLATIPELAGNEASGFEICAFSSSRKLSTSSGRQAAFNFPERRMAPLGSLSLEHLSYRSRKLKLIANSGHPSVICNASSMKIAKSEECLQSRGQEREREVQRC